MRRDHTRRSCRAGCIGRPDRRRFHHPDFNARETQGWKALDAEGRISGDGWRREQEWALEMGLPGAESLTDRTIPTFARGELPHFAGINTFLKAPYIEDVHEVGDDVLKQPGVVGDDKNRVIRPAQ